MTFWYNIGAICILSAICLPFLIKSKAVDPEDKEKKPFKPMKPVEDIELDEWEEFYMKRTKARLIFTPKALPFILKAFNKGINESGIVVDETGEPVLTPEGEEITKDNFGGIKKGSLIFLKKDLLTAIKLSEGKY